MTSPNGFTWTIRNCPINTWMSVAYGNGLWVAVGDDIGGNNNLMTSPDGFTWTSRNNAANNRWISVAYGNGLWVAVSYSGTGNRVMTSGSV